MYPCYNLDVCHFPSVIVCCIVLSGEHEEGISEETDEYRTISSSLQSHTQRPPEEVCPGSAERTVCTESPPAFTSHVHKAPTVNASAIHTVKCDLISLSNNLITVRLP